MKISATITKTVVAICALAALLVMCETAVASDYDNKDFSLRFPAALSRFANYGDVAGLGGASAASKWSSSINPASTGWLDIQGPVQMYAAGQYTRMEFDNGTNFNVFAESLTIDADDWGTFTVAAAQGNSNRTTMRDGFDFHFTTDRIYLLWAKKFTEKTALGASVQYNKSSSRYDLGPIPIAKSNSDVYNISVGVLHEFAPKWLGGMVVDYGWSHDRTNYYAIPAFALPEVHVYDNTRQFLVRPGVTWEYMDESTIYVDYQFATFWNNTGTLNTHRVFAGIEHKIFKGVFLRGGTTVDICQQAYAWTGGVGFYPTSWVSLDVAYQYDMFPEIAKEFGRGQTLNVSLSFTF